MITRGRILARKPTRDAFEDQLKRRWPDLIIQPIPRNGLSLVMPTREGMREVVQFAADSYLQPRRTLESMNTEWWCQVRVYGFALDHSS